MPSCSSAASFSFSSTSMPSASSLAALRPLDGAGSAEDPASEPASDPSEVASEARSAREGAACPSEASCRGALGGRGLWAAAAARSRFAYSICDTLLLRCSCSSTCARCAGSMGKHGRSPCYPMLAQLGPQHLSTTKQARPPAPPYTCMCNA